MNEGRQIKETAELEFAPKAAAKQRSKHRSFKHFPRIDAAHSRRVLRPQPGAEW